MTTRGWMPLAGAISALLLACGAQAEELRPRLSRGPYLQMADASSVTIVWRTLGSVQPAVRFGEKPGALDRSVPPQDIRVRMSREHAGEAPQLPPLAEVPDGTCQYEAVLRGLRPQTTYYYGVFDGDRLLAGNDADHRFSTYPPAGQAAPVRFAALSDSHGKSWFVMRMQRLIREFCDNDPSGLRRPPDFMLHCGDIAGRGHDLELQATSEALAWNMRQMVCWISPGNHDGMPPRLDGPVPYTDLFVLPTRGECGGAPSGTEAYYSFDFGRLHVVSLASFPEGLDRAAMAKWLREDLARVRAEGKTDWLVAFFHSPVYESTWADTKLDSIEMREQFMPILEDGGVDLVCGGHLHVYERTVLIDGAYATPQTTAGVVLNDGDGDPEGDGAYLKSAGLHPHEGTVGVITGHVNDPIMRSDGLHPLVRRALVEVGMTLVDIDGDTLTVRMVNIEGKVRDRFSIVKRGKVAPRRLARPRPGESFYFRDRLPGMRFALVPVLAQGPKMDGALDDEVWKKALPTLSGRVFATPEALYVGAVLDTGVRPERPLVRDANMLKEPASIDLVVDPRYDRETCYYFATNCDGAQADGRNGDLSYNPEWEVRTLKGLDRNPNRWSLEMRIPWRALEMPGPPDENTVMGMNLRQRWGTWSTSREWFLGRGDPRFLGVIVPREFGMVKFGPGRAEALIEPHDTWSYLTGAHPGPMWAGPDFAPTGWRSGKAGFGYGDVDNSTPLPDMQGRYSTVYIRKEFGVPDPATVADLGLIINYDDAFIAYLNGEEVLRVGVGAGRGADVRNIRPHEGGLPGFSLADYVAHIRRHNGAAYYPLPGLPTAPEYFSLKPHLGLLRKGSNVLAIEGHNASVSSKSFTLDPCLVATRRE